MFDSDRSRRNAIAMTIGWWYVRRLVRRRGPAAVAAFLAGEGLTFARQPRRRRPLRWLLLGGLVAGGGLLWWRRRQGGGGDDWGDWEPLPIVPDAPMPAEPEPEPVPDTGPTSGLSVPGSVTT